MFSFKPSKPPPAKRKRIVGQKPPLKIGEIWAVRVRLQLIGNLRDLALFNLAIDSKLRACDLVALRVHDVFQAGRATRRGIVIQQKTRRPVRFEITELTQKSINDWVRRRRLRPDEYLFPSRAKPTAHLSRRQYARLVDQWIEAIGLDSRMYGTHSLRRTKVSLIYRRTRNLRAVQLLLGHSKIEHTIRYLGVEVEDALELAEQTEA